MHNLDVIQEEIGLCFTIDRSLPGRGYLALLQKAVQYADRAGFSFAWVMEAADVKQNPTIIQSTLSVQTKRIALRGQCLSPDRRDAIRSVEDWSIVDNLSNGRIGVMVAADFDEAMNRHVAELRGLWKGESVKRMNGVGKEVELKVFPRPLQKELPIWVCMTAAHDETAFKKAGELGVHILVTPDLHSAEKTVQYRKAAKEQGRVAWLVDPGYGNLSADGVNEIAFKVDLSWGEARVINCLENLAASLKSMNPA
ncbi:LLM class flavin-dependent oxidoreductase [Chitinophaga sp.]|uniref:LLM class flavin-dependent oxidoreductase n=1 Tax=Chitinophaga sp. TaxID=1869181 RepID=UPI002F94DC41